MDILSINSRPAVPRFLAIAACVVMGGALAACQNFDIPSTASSENVRVQENAYHLSFAADEIDAPSYQAIGAYYRRYGAGAVDLYVTYMPASRDVTALSATEMLRNVAAGLESQGVRVGERKITAAADEPKHVVHIHFKTHTAMAPEGCDNTQKPISYNLDDLSDYRTGCNMQSYFARQIYRPSDLLGRSGVSPHDAQSDYHHGEGLRRLDTPSLSVSD